MRVVAYIRDVFKGEILSDWLEVLSLSGTLSPLGGRVDVEISTEFPVNRTGFWEKRVRMWEKYRSSAPLMFAEFIRSYGGIDVVKGVPSVEIYVEDWRGMEQIPLFCGVVRSSSVNFRNQNREGRLTLGLEGYWSYILTETSPTDLGFLSLGEVVKEGRDTVLRFRKVEVEEKGGGIKIGSLKFLNLLYKKLKGGTENWASGRFAGIYLETFSEVLRDVMRIDLRFDRGTDFKDYLFDKSFRDMSFPISEVAQQQNVGQSILMFLSDTVYQEELNVFGDYVSFEDESSPFKVVHSFIPLTLGDLLKVESLSEPFAKKSKGLDRGYVIPYEYITSLSWSVGGKASGVNPSVFGIGEEGLVKFVHPKLFWGNWRWNTLRISKIVFVDKHRSFVEGVVKNVNESLKEEKPLPSFTTTLDRFTKDILSVLRDGGEVSLDFSLRSETKFNDSLSLFKGMMIKAFTSYNIDVEIPFNPFIQPARVVVLEFEKVKFVGFINGVSVHYTSDTGGGTMKLEVSGWWMEDDGRIVMADEPMLRGLLPSFG